MTCIAAAVGAIISALLLLALYEVRTRRQVETVLSILRTHGELPGAGIVERSNGGVSSGSVYAILTRLLEAGKVTARTEYDRSSSALPRRYYRLTDPN